MRGFNLTVSTCLQFISLYLWIKISESLAIMPTQGFALLTSHSNLLWVKEKGAVGRSLGAELKHCFKTFILQTTWTYPGVHRGGKRCPLPLHTTAQSKQERGRACYEGGEPWGATAHSWAPTWQLAHQSLPWDVVAAMCFSSLPPAPSAAAATTSQATCLSKLHGRPSQL